MGRCRSMGFLKSFLSCASQLFEASILVFLISHMPPSSSALRLRVGGWWHLLNRRHCFLFREPSFTFGSPKTLMAVTCLFTDVAGNVSFTVPLYGWKFNHMWETFHDFFFFVPLLWKDVWDQRKVLVDMLLQVLTYRLGPLIDNRRFSGSFIF